MNVCRSKTEARLILGAWKRGGHSIGFVPTMGYLHDGHLSLVNRARSRNDKVVVSIFVNPLQFGPGEDFERYPRDTDKDLALCAENGVDMVFLPEPDVIYPQGFATSVTVAGVSEGLCGRVRPGHFRGVATVVCKLLNIITPDEAYFGDKDAQQVAVIRRMVCDLDIPVRVTGCPIVREADGLALSSRNVYLSAEERKAALVLSQSLDKAVRMRGEGVTDPSAILAAVEQHIRTEPLAELEYAVLVDPDTMQPRESLCQKTLLAVAAKLGPARLIDNVMLG